MTRMEDYLWNPAAEPVEDIAALERVLTRYRHRLQPLPARRPRRRSALRWGLLAASASVVGLFAGRTVWLNRPVPPWSVHTESGRVTVRGAPVGTARVTAGDVLATNSSGRARLRVGRIGDVYLSPGTEIEVSDDGAAEHRLTLRRGELHARIWAPPRYFVVNTRWAAAVDLGCIYTLRVDDAGAALLEVYHGHVELAAATGSVLVAAGTAAAVSAAGPGVPWPLGSGPAFRNAAAALAGGSADVSHLATVLAGADAQGTITLWHLLPRVPAALRPALVDRVAELVAPPAGVDRARVLALDADALAVWETVLRPRWSSEPDTRWRRFLLRWRLAKPVALLQLHKRME